MLDFLFNLWNKTLIKFGKKAAQTDELFEI